MRRARLVALTPARRSGWFPFRRQARQMAADPVVMEAVSHTFGAVRAIDEISLAIPGGTILGLIGPSGSGKTTTIRTLTGALEPTSGTVRVLGEDPREFRRGTRERIGYAPQLFVLYADLSARENVDFVGSLFGMLWRKRRRRVRDVLTLLGLWEARGRRASQLSGGMQRRLELACALVHEPDLLFLDEPTAGVDPLLRQTIWDELRRLRDQGRTVLVTTQYVAEAEHCDTVALISSGKLIAHASPEELRRRALGGEVIRVETRSAFDAADLGPIPGVTEVRQTGPRELLVIAENAGEAVPRVVDAIAASRGEVVSSREYRPTFDEVFAALLRGSQNE
ncbi:MAG: ABC transporter ATP-binding protein [Chloroflexota bacterium]|nr:ABC transporter ATP-binding protein [Chloroflexota bacterium]